MAYSLRYYFNSTSQSYSVTGYSNITESDIVVIPDTYDDGTNGSHPVTSIGDVAFQNCEKLTSVIIPDSVTSIDYFAFSGCSSLTSITIPNSVKSIGSSAFSGCSSLEEITIPFVGKVAGKTASDTYQYPFGYIFGTNSYTGGTAVRQYYYGSSTSSTTNTTYYIPSSLRKVTVTGGNILRGAFNNCSMLTSITIPEGATSIGESAFAGCTSLISVKIPNGVTIIGASAFYGCSSLASIAIPNGVKSIPWGLFYGCINLTSVTIGNAVASIGDSVFYGCSSLTSINIPDSVTSIGWGPFYGCSRLTSITIPNSVTSIGDSAFNHCSSLTSVTIFDNVKSIGNYAFDNCTNLKIIALFPSTPPTLGTSAIPTAVSTIYVLQSSKEAYKGETNWTSLSSKIVSDNVYLSFVRFNQKNKEYIDGKVREAEQYADDKKLDNVPPDLFDITLFGYQYNKPHGFNLTENLQPYSVPYRNRKGKFLTGEVNSDDSPMTVVNKKYVDNLSNDIDTAISIAKGRATGYVFDTKDDMDAWLENPENVSMLVLGDNLYIRAVDTPDYWWDGSSAQMLETQKVDLTGYVKQSYVDSYFISKPTTPTEDSAVILNADGTTGTKPLSKLGGVGGAVDAAIERLRFKTLLDYTIPDGETLGDGVPFSDIIVIEDIEVSEIIISISIPPADPNAVQAKSGLLIAVTEDGTTYKQISAAVSLGLHISNIVYSETTLTFFQDGYKMHFANNGYEYNSPNVMTNSWAPNGLKASTNSGIVRGLKLIEGYPNGRILQSGTKIRVYGR